MHWPDCFEADIEQEANKYILANEKEKCLHCLAIWERHENVLEFKAGECRVNILAKENICDISPDLPLHTLARLGA